MPTFAALGGDTVTNIVVANTLADAELATRLTCVEYTADNPAGIGWLYDETTNTFSPPQTLSD